MSSHVSQSDNAKYVGVYVFILLPQPHAWAVLRLSVLGNDSQIKTDCTNSLRGAAYVSYP